MRSRARGIVAGILVVLSAAALSLIAATPASADEAECLPTYLASDGRELFDIEPQYIPPPLRAFPADCASRVTTQPFAEGRGGTYAYVLLYTDIPFHEYIAILRSFEHDGWIEPTSPHTVIRREATSTDEPASIADLEALGSIPSFARSRLSDQQSGVDIIEMTYSSGTPIDPSLTAPALTISIIAHQRFVATDIDDPSVFSSLRTITEVAPTPVQTGVIAGGAVALMLLVGWPANLLNSVVGSRYDGLVRWLRKRFRRPPRDAPDAVAKPSRLPGWLMWPGFALAAIIGAFVDPDFGWNPMSVRVVLTLFASFVLFNVVTWAIVRVIARRLQPDSDPVLRFRWGSLFLVILSVVIARLLQLEPGIIFGLVAGVAYGTALRTSRSAVIALVGSGFGLALALVAWVGYSLLAPATAGSDSVPVIVATEFLAAVTVKGVSSLPLALLPLGTLDGAKVAKWRRLVWAVAYAVGLAAFMLVLLTVPKAWGDVPGDFLRWLVVFGGYGLFALILWAVNSWWVRRHPPKESAIGEQPDAITID